MSLQDVLTGESWIECSRDLLVLTRHVTGSQGKKRAQKKGCVVADKASRRGAGVGCRFVTCWGSVKKGQAARWIMLNPDDAICIISGAYI